MLVEAYEFFDLNITPTSQKYFETEAHKKITKNLKFSIYQGGIFALIGMVGSGKTTLLRRLEREIEQEGKIIVSRCLSTDKKRVNVSVLFTALFADLGKNEKNFIFSTTAEKRERDLVRILSKKKKPVVLFIDEAHDLHGKTLISLKRLVEFVSDNGYVLTIILAGHPKLMNSLSTSTMEEINARLETVSLDGSIGDNDKFIRWWFENNVKKKPLKISENISDEAIKYLAQELLTPLQIIFYLKLSIKLAYDVGEKPITLDIVKQVMHPDLKSIQAKLARNGYQEPAVCELFNATKKEVRDFFAGKGNKDRNIEFNQKLHYLNIN
ncbi:AAA family ATPase [Francisellaceae bacterium CB300]